MAKPDSDVSSQPESAAERIVYMYPSAPVGPSDDVDLRVIWRSLIRDRWIVIALSFLGLASGATCAWLSPAWYRAEVRLLPEVNGGRAPLGTQSSLLGELAGMAGVVQERDIRNETLSLMRSREFVRGFLVDEGLVDMVCRLAAASPDVETAVGIFTGVSSVREDAATGTVVLSIDWKDAVTPVDIANRMVSRVNRVARDRAISEATTNVESLRGQLAEAQDAPLREVINRLLQVELQKVVVAKGRTEFAFRIMDPARAPAGRVGRSSRLIAAVGFAGGFMLALMIVFVRSVSRRQGT